MSRKPDLPNTSDQNSRDQNQCPNHQNPQNQNPPAGAEVDPNENLQEFHRIYDGIVEESRRQAMNWMILLEQEYGDLDDPNFTGKPTKLR